MLLCINLYHTVTSVSVSVILLSGSEVLVKIGIGGTLVAIPPVGSTAISQFLSLNTRTLALSRKSPTASV